jgi:hypothetical protein
VPAAASWLVGIISKKYKELENCNTLMDAYIQAILLAEQVGIKFGFIVSGVPGFSTCFSSHGCYLMWA